MRSGVLGNWWRWRSALACTALSCALFALLLAGGRADAASAAPSFEAHGSVEQVYATGLAPRARLTLVDRKGRKLATKRADSLGGVLFRNVKPGGGYRVGLASGGAKSGPLRVLSTKAAPPSTSVYDQTIPPSGYGYLTTRDGTKLAIDVHPAQGVSGAGPVPTLIEYSGYGYADPAGPQSGIAILANLMGFTVVDVNMRGTGCSGGAFDFFEPLQNLDGYDVIETIARQPWVAAPQGRDDGHLLRRHQPAVHRRHQAAEPGRDRAAVGDRQHPDDALSGRHPQHRASRSTGRRSASTTPSRRRRRAASRGPTSGSRTATRPARTTRPCTAEAVNLLAKIQANNHYRPKVADPLAPITFVHKIDVPIFMACQWTDEQTGGHCPDLAEHFTGTRQKWFTFTNGTHIDSLDPETFNRWFDFLELYVAKQAPIVALRGGPRRGAADLPGGDGDHRA